MKAKITRLRFSLFAKLSDVRSFGWLEDFLRFWPSPCLIAVRSPGDQLHVVALRQDGCLGAPHDNRPVRWP